MLQHFQHHLIGAQAVGGQPAGKIFDGLAIQQKAFGIGVQE